MAIGQTMHRSRDAKLQGRVCCASHVTGSLTSDLLPHIEETVFCKMMHKCFLTRRVGHICFSLLWHVSLFRNMRKGGETSAQNTRTVNNSDRWWKEKTSQDKESGDLNQTAFHDFPFPLTLGMTGQETANLPKWFSGLESTIYISALHTVSHHHFNRCNPSLTHFVLSSLIPV